MAKAFLPSATAKFKRDKGKVPHLFEKARAPSALPRTSHGVNKTTLKFVPSCCYIPTLPKVQ